MNPAAAEDPTDALDDDCDDLTTIRRDYVTGMGPAVFGEWDQQRATVNAPTNRVHLTPAGSNGSGKAWISMKYSANEAYALPWSRGVAYVYVSMPSIAATANCNLSLAGTGMSPMSHALAVGVNEVSATPTPNGALTQVKVECSGTGVAQVDWVTVQNGPLEWAPMLDLDGATTDAGVASHGYQAFVRPSDDGSVIYQGSDVGGIAWTDATLDWGSWITANGDTNDTRTLTYMGTWDAWSPDGDEVYALKGQKDTASYGGLWHSLDRGFSWDALTFDVGASRHLKECSMTSGLNYKSFGAGHLLLHDAASDILYIGSGAPGARGLWAVDRTSSTIVEVDALATLGVGDGLPRWDCLEDSTSDGDCSGTISALALGETEDGDPVLVVGYRAITWDDADFHDAVFVCEAPGGLTELTARVSCYPAGGVDGAEYDVRDIEVDPLDPSVFYIADGGFRYADLSTKANECATDLESTVRVMRVHAVDDAEVADTDAAPLAGPPEPTWVARPYYGSAADNFRDVVDCYAGVFGAEWGPGLDAGGELLPPASGQGAVINAVEVDPGGAWLFAGYSAGYNHAAGCAHLYRTPLRDEADAEWADEGWPWRPMSSVPVDTDASGAAWDDRHNAVDLGGTKFRDEPAAFNWVAGVQDLAFHDVGGADWMVTLNEGPWRLQPEAGATPGWNVDTTTLETFDHLPWTSMEQEAPFFSTVTVGDLASCQDCASGVDELGVAVGDLLELTGYGDDGTGYHQPAVSDCHYDVPDIPAGGVAVAFYEAGGGVLYQRWYARGAGPYRFLHLTTADNLMGVHHEETCWQGSYSTSQYILPDPGLSGLYGIACFDKDDTDMDFECSEFGKTALDDQGVGTIRRILPYAWDHALAITEAACLAYDSAGNCTSSVGGGLELAEHDPTTDAITWTPVDTTGLDSLLTTSWSTCTTASYYGAYLDAVYDTVGYEQTGILRVFMVSSTDCPAVSLDIDPASATVTDVAAWDVEQAGSPCVNNPDVNFVAGLVLSADGTTLLVAGGYSATTTYGGVCAVDVGGIDELGSVVSVEPNRYEVAVPASDPGGQLAGLVAHPYLNDQFVVGGLVDASCSGCEPAGLWLVQRRYRPHDAAVYWDHRRITGVDWGFPSIGDLAWGSPDPWPAVSALYTGTPGGGVQQVDLSW